MNVEQLARTLRQDPAFMENVTRWETLPAREAEIHERSVYCIPELHRDRIKPDTMIIMFIGAVQPMWVKIVDHSVSYSFTFTMTR